MVVAINGVATGRHVLQRLKRQAVEDGVLRRPVGTNHCVLVLITLELRGLDRTSFETSLQGGNGRRHLGPHVDQIIATIATDNVNVATRGRDTRNVNSVTGLDDSPDLLGVAVNQGNFTSITQGDGENVGQVDVVHLLGRTLVDRDQQLPATLDVCKAPLRGRFGRHLEVGSHVDDLLLGQNVVEVDHAAFGTVGDDFLQTALAELGRVRRLKVLTGRTLAQHAVAASATLEIQLASFGLVSSRQGRCSGGSGGRGGSSFLLCRGGKGGRYSQRQSSQQKGVTYKFLHISSPLIENRRALSQSDINAGR